MADEGSSRKRRNRELEEATLGATLSDHVSNGERAECSKVKTSQWDTLHKEGVPPIFENSGFMLFSFVVVFLPYVVGSLLPNLPV